MIQSIPHVVFANTVPCIVALSIVATFHYATSHGLMLRCQPMQLHLSSIEEDNSSKKADLKRNSNSIMREQKMASITHSQRSFNLFCFQRAFFWMQMFKGNLFRVQERRLSRLSRLRRRWGIFSLLRWLNIGRLSKIKITAALEMPLQ